MTTRHDFANAAVPRALSVAVAAAFFGLCPAAQSGTRLNGIVVDVNGAPVAQARVTLARPTGVDGATYTTVFTDAAGRYAFARPIPDRIRSEVTLEANALGFRMAFPEAGPAHLRPAADGRDALEMVVVMQPQHNMADTAPASAWLKAIPDSDPGKSLIVRECVACHQIVHSDMRNFVRLMDAAAASRSKEARKQSWEKLLTYMYGTSHEYFAGGIGFTWDYQISGNEAQYLAPVAEFLAAKLPSRLDFVEYSYGAPLAVTPTTEIREYAIPNLPDQKFNAVGVREAVLAGKPLELWVADVASDHLYRIDPETGKLDALKVPAAGASAPHSIYIGHDGKIWLTYLFQQLHGTIDPQSGAFSLEQSKTARGDYYVMHDFATDAHDMPMTDRHGRLWFGDVASNSLGSIDPKTHAATLYRSPEKLLVKEHADTVASSAGVHLDDLYMYGTVITADRGHVWYTQLNGRFGEFNTETLRYETTVDVPAAAGPRRLAITERDILYVPLFGAGQIVEYDARAHRQLGVYDLPDRAAAPYAVTWDPGRQVLWVATSNADAIYRFHPKDHSFGVIPLPRQREYLRMMQVEPETGFLVTSTALLPARAPGPRMALIVDPGDGYRRKGEDARVPRTTTAPPGDSAPRHNVSVAELEKLSRANQCTSCHSVTDARIGPPFLAVAARYADRPRSLSIEILAAKILCGGAGNWGVFPMPARERMFTADEARTLAAAIIDLQPPQN